MTPAESFRQAPRLAFELVEGPPARDTAGAFAAAIDCSDALTAARTSITTAHVTLAGLELEQHDTDTVQTVLAGLHTMLDTARAELVDADTATERIMSKLRGDDEPQPVPTNLLAGNVL